MSVPITNPCKRCRIGGACAGEYCWPVMPPCAMLVEAHSTAPNTARDEICPKCDYGFPRLRTGGSYKCDECGFIWVGQTSPIL